MPGVCIEHAEVLKCSAISVSFDGVKALQSVSLVATANEILGLIGPNGAGKTTLFNVLSGLVRADEGSARFREEELVGIQPHRIADMGIGRTFQQVRLVRRISVVENVLLGFRHLRGEWLPNVFLRPRLCHEQERCFRNKAHELLAVAGLLGNADVLAGSLSYGQEKLLSLLMCLAADAKLLLLDEPIAGIAPEMAKRILKIITDLPKQGKSAIVIEHDIDALKGIAHRMVFMDAGRKVCEGTPDEVLDDPRVIEAYLG